MTDNVRSRSGSGSGSGLADSSRSGYYSGSGCLNENDYQLQLDRDLTGTAE